MQKVLLSIAFLYTITTISCRSKKTEGETKAHVTVNEPQTKDSTIRLEGEFFEPNQATHKIVFNGNSLCLYHGWDADDEYKIYRGEVSIEDKKVTIFFRGENHPTLVLRISSDRNKNIYLRGEGTSPGGRKVLYNFVGTKF